MKALTVARGTVIECLRDRVLYLPLIFVLFILLGSLFFGSIALGEMERLVLDFGVAGITFFSLLTAVFLGIGWSYQGVTRRTAYALLAQPIPRRAVLWGAYLGLAAIQLLSLIIMALSWWCILRLVGIPWQGVHALTLGLLLVEVLLVTALAFFLSTVASPGVAGATTVVLLLAGYASRGLRDLAGAFPDVLLRGVANAVYYVIPCLSNFSPTELGIGSVNGGWEQALWAVSYGLSYTAGLLALSAVVFSRREFA